ncbi:unnamed protein product, partial [Polarella glacialis]
AGTSLWCCRYSELVLHGSPAISVLHFTICHFVDLPLSETLLPAFMQNMTRFIPGISVLGPKRNLMLVWLMALMHQCMTMSTSTDVKLQHGEDDLCSTVASGGRSQTGRSLLQAFQVRVRRQTETVTDFTFGEKDSKQDLWNPSKEDLMKLSGGERQDVQEDGESPRERHLQEEDASSKRRTSTVVLKEFVMQEAKSGAAGGASAKALLQAGSEVKRAGLQLLGLVTGRAVQDQRPVVGSGSDANAALVNAGSENYVGGGDWPQHSVDLLIKFWRLAPCLTSIALQGGAATADMITRIATSTFVNALDTHCLRGTAVLRVQDAEGPQGAGLSRRALVTGTGEVLAMCGRSRTSLPSNMLSAIVFEILRPNGDVWGKLSYEARPGAEDKCTIETNTKQLLYLHGSVRHYALN